MEIRYAGAPAARATTACAHRLAALAPGHPLPEPAWSALREEVRVRAIPSRERAPHYTGLSAPPAGVRAYGDEPACFPVPFLASVPRVVSGPHPAANEPISSAGAVVPRFRPAGALSVGSARHHPAGRGRHCRVQCADRPAVVLHPCAPAEPAPAGLRRAGPEDQLAAGASGQFDAVLFGSSRSTYIDQRDFAPWRMFNHAVNAMWPREYQAYLDHFTAVNGRAPDLVVLGVDFFGSSRNARRQMASARDLSAEGR